MSPMQLDGQHDAVPARTFKSSGDFKLLAEESLEFSKDVKVVKWQSESTGLKVVWADVEGELCFPMASRLQSTADRNSRAARSLSWPR